MPLGYDSAELNDFSVAQLTLHDVVLRDYDLRVCVGVTEPRVNPIQ
jgi:hypothetical protein